MAGCCHDHRSDVFDGTSAAYRRVLMLVIAINAGMFIVELTAGITAQSMALQADALDFLGDSVTYALSLAVIGSALAVRARMALVKGISLAVLGLWVLGATVWRVWSDGTPDEIVMGGVGLLAFAANVVSAVLLMAWRDGDANVRSVWLCSRNDAIGNVAVMLAAGAVWLTASPWPDLLVAVAMAALFLRSSVEIVRRSLAEMAQARGDRPTADDPASVPAVGD